MHALRSSTLTLAFNIQPSASAFLFWIAGLTVSCAGQIGWTDPVRHLPGLIEPHVTVELSHNEGL
jgi:hypothetical protein